jgi:hypothetical protein
MQYNGVQLNITGLDMRTQFMDQGINNLPNPDSPEINSLPNNPIYNLLQVLFRGKQTDNISRYNGNDLFSHQNNGLRAYVNPEGHKLMTIG